MRYHGKFSILLLPGLTRVWETGTHFYATSETKGRGSNLKIRFIFLAEFSHNVFCINLFIFCTIQLYSYLLLFYSLHYAKYNVILIHINISMILCDFPLFGKTRQNGSLCPNLVNQRPIMFN